MVGKIYKWFLAVAVVGLLSAFVLHPIYVSVAEIEYNKAASRVEVSYKVFIDDFEKTLRATYKSQVDLLDEKKRAAMDKLVSSYLKQHLVISVNGKPLDLEYLGYERIDEGIYCYFEAPYKTEIKSLVVYNDVMYKYIPEQMAIVHFLNNGQRTSSKLLNPANQVTFSVK